MSAMKVEVVRTRKAEIPALKFDAKILEQIGSVAEGTILDNIRSQSQADGSPIEENKESTKARKRAKGRPELSLIDALHRFVRGRGRSWAVQVDTHGSKIFIEPATSELKRLSAWVQMKGYVGWFGLTAKSSDLIRLLIRRWIEKEFQKAAKKS